MQRKLTMGCSCPGVMEKRDWEIIALPPVRETLQLVIPVTAFCQVTGSWELKEYVSNKYPYNIWLLFQTIFWVVVAIINNLLHSYCHLILLNYFIYHSFLFQSLPPPISTYSSTHTHTHINKIFQIKLFLIVFIFT